MNQFTPNDVDRYHSCCYVFGPTCCWQPASVVWLYCACSICLWHSAVSTARPAAPSTGCRRHYWRRTRLDYVVSDRPHTTGRLQQSMSLVQTVLCGVPLGSVIGPLLCVLYTAELSEVIMCHGLNVHQYTDDPVVSEYTICRTVWSHHVSWAECLSVYRRPSCIWVYYLMTHLAVERLDACLVDVKAWLRASCPRLNPTKTQVMWLGSGQQLAKVDTDEVSLLALRVHVLDAAWNLGVIFDSQLSMSAASSLTASCQCRHRFQLCVVLAITSSGICVRLFDACLRMPPKSWSRLSSIIFGWITATRCISAGGLMSSLQSVRCTVTFWRCAAK